MATINDNLDLDLPEIIHSISQKTFDLDYYSRQISENERLRDELVAQMCQHPDIMVYYHCFYVIEKASQYHPELFYKYFPDFQGLLSHPNSYHRDFGLILIATLARVDEGNLINGILEAYLQHVCDPKFMTARCCVQNCGRIIQIRPELIERIVTSLMASENGCPYSAGQKALLRFDLLEIFQLTGVRTGLNDLMRGYILDSMKSESPKTRKKAKELAVTFNLIS